MKRLKEKPIFLFIPPKDTLDALPQPESQYHTTIINNYYEASKSMDSATLAASAASLIKPFLGKNKAIKQITSEITEAANTSLLELWELIKPIFIEEFEKDEKLTEKAEDEPIVAHEIEKRMERDAIFKSDLEQRLQAVERHQAGQPIVIGSSNIVNTGDIKHTQGDVIIGGTKHKP